MIFKLTAAVPQLWQFLVSLVRSLLLRIIESITEFSEQSELTERKAEEGQRERKSEWEMCYCQDLVFFCFHCKKIMMWSCHSLQKKWKSTMLDYKMTSKLWDSQRNKVKQIDQLCTWGFFLCCVVCVILLLLQDGDLGLHCERWEVWSQGCLEVRENHNLEELEDSQPAFVMAK